MSSQNIYGRIVCPKCGTKTMRKSIPQTFGMEYFDDKCHTYFGVNELVNKWGYDASDMIGFYVSGYPCDPNPFDAVSDDFEVTWENLNERLEAYEMVDRMFIGIPEWSMDDYSVDTGAQHV